MARQFLTDAIVETTRNKIMRDADGIGETFVIGAAMAFDTDAFEAKKHRTVVAPRIGAQFQFLQGAARQKITKQRQGRGAERLAQEMRHQRRRALNRLERDVAAEAIGDDDIHSTFENVIAFDET